MRGDSRSVFLCVAMNIGRLCIRLFVRGHQEQSGESGDGGQQKELVHEGLR